MQGVALVRGGRLLFDRFDLALGAEDAAVLRGANGVGKSSLLRLAAGLLRPDAGTVRVGAAALQDEGLALGADEYFATEDPDALKALRGRFDLIINTVSADIPVDRYLATLRLDGALVFVGLPENPQQFRAFSLTGARRSLAGSNIGGIRETQEMLDYCAEKGISSDIELIPIQKIDEAYDRTVRGDVRYRFVIDIASLTK